MNSPLPDPEAPAGLLRRTVAYVLDASLVQGLCWPLFWLGSVGPRADWAQAQAQLNVTGDPVAFVHAAVPAISALVTLQTVLYVVLAAVYFIGMEASSWQGSLGKHALGLRVVDLLGRPLSMQRAAARFAASGLSWATMNLGHAMAGWRQDRRALHDLVAGTQVVGRRLTGAQTAVMVGTLIGGAVLALIVVVTVIQGMVAGLSVPMNV